MKNNLLIIFLGIFIHSCSSTKRIEKRMRYFDENNLEISKSKFKKIRLTNKFLDIKGDSINHKKLIVREESGKINNRPLLKSLLEKETNQKLDPNKPIVIIYYPGKDKCNSSGSATKESTKKWYEQLEKGISQIAGIKPIYIYKSFEGLNSRNDTSKWYKDPNETIERLFFKHHYPCSSFVVISKDGNYISYFGEFGMEYVWTVTQFLNK